MNEARKCCSGCDGRSLEICKKWFGNIKAALT